MNPAIRPYRPEDKAQLLDLLRLNTPQYFAPEEEVDLIHYLDHEVEQYFVMELDNRIIGCGGINFFPGESAARISWDIMHPGQQGKGYGKQLLQHRINHILALDQTYNIMVRTTQLAYKFYERSGFVLKETVKDYWAEGFDLYRMEYEGY